MRYVKVCASAYSLKGYRTQNDISLHMHNISR